MPGKIGSDRLAIRRAAYHCFSESGYEKTTIDSICQRLGISKGSFYWYYSSKQAVFASILDDWAETIEIELAAVFRDALAGPRPFDKVGRALTVELRRGRHVMPIWLEFLAEAMRVPRIREGLAGFQARIRRFLVGLLEPAFLPHVTAADREAVAAVILAAYIGIVSQEIVDPAELNASASVRSFMSTLQNLLSPAGGPASPPVG